MSIITESEEVVPAARSALECGGATCRLAPVEKKAAAPQAALPHSKALRAKKELR